MIYISLGSNLGNRLENLRLALRLLKPFFKSLSCSIILETKALLLPGAPAAWDKPFLNMVAWGESLLSPSAMLEALKKIEHTIGRPLKYEKWAPRIIDLDILLWGEESFETPELVVPHPQLIHRPFLLHLLGLCSPLKLHPVLQKTCGELAASSSEEKPFEKAYSILPELIGIVNVTSDSFSDGGQFLMADRACQQVMKLWEDGACIVEVGAQSTRPLAPLITAEEEYARLEPVLKQLSLLLEEVIPLSIDSYCDEVILKSLELFPFQWVNDVSGALKKETLKTISQRQCQIVTMHSLSIPPTKEKVLPLREDPFIALNKWAEEKIDYLLACGFKEEDIILDPGIGFGKTTYQNIYFLQQWERRLSFKGRWMMGHSRKSYHAAFSTELAPYRDLETIATSYEVVCRTGDLLRVHNVRGHQRFFVTQDILRGGVRVL